MAQTEVLPKQKLRVLIADDIQETRRSLRLILSMNPDVVVVAIAKDGQEAVALSKEHHPDVVILDINMPNKNGLMAFEEIRQIDPYTGCIIITGEGGTDLLGEAMAVGAQEYLLKPFSIEELNEAVNRVGALVLARHEKHTREDQEQRQNADYLVQMAEEYAHSRRTDDEALWVFEQLAENPTCALRWLRTLAMMFVVRQEWSKLTALSVRLERYVGGDKQ